MERFKFEGSMEPINPVLGHKRVEKLYERLYRARTTLRQFTFGFMEREYLFQLDDNHEYVQYGHHKLFEVLDKLEEMYLFFKEESDRLGELLAEMAETDKVEFLIDMKRERK